MTKRTYPLDKYGYVTTWLITGRLDTPVDPATRPKGLTQGQYEREQRLTVHNDDMKKPPEGIELGAPGINSSLPWKLYPSGPNSFIDLSKFYFTICRCDFWAATSIVSPYDQKVEADIWTFPSYDAWLNGEHISVCPDCRYYPMKRNRVTLSLKKGENEFFLRVQNACTRDTHNIVALCFPNKPDITVAYPGEKKLAEQQRSVFDWVYSFSWTGERLIASTNAPEGASLTVNGTAVNGNAYTLEANTAVARLRATLGDYAVERTVEISERFVPAQKKEWASADEARESFLNSLAERTVPADRSDVQFFYTTYARLCKGYPLDDNDIRVINTCLADIDIQKDCSDFRFGYILASVKKGLLPEYLVEKIHKSALSFCYWDDEKPIGTMCYGTENHSLLFHTCQLLAGMLWPDDIFLSSGRTGKEQEAIATHRIEEWITKMENNGCSEFLSGGYIPITVAAMLTVVDFARDDLSERCARLIDDIFYAIAHNTFDGVIYAPMGRVYRGAIRPWNEGTQTLLYFATGSAAPNGIGALGSWLAPFVDTKYKVPSDVEAYVNQKGMYYGKVNGSRVLTFKGEHFMLTSLPLELTDGKCFGRLLPGAVGHQQHLSYATLGGACIVFSQHPGLPYDSGSVKPGYWFGNGFFPQQKQWDNVLGQVFPISEEFPIKFTHLYFPIRTFDQTEQDSNWLFGKRGEGYVAVWCSNKLSLFDGDIVQGCDYRAEEGASAYLTVCGDSLTNGSFESFKKYAKEFAPEFNRETLILTTSKGQKIGGEFIALDDPRKFRIVV